MTLQLHSVRTSSHIVFCKISRSVSFAYRHDPKISFRTSLNVMNNLFSNHFSSSARNSRTPPRESDERWRWWPSERRWKSLYISSLRQDHFDPHVELDKKSSGPSFASQIDKLTEHKFPSSHNVVPPSLSLSPFLSLSLSQQTEQLDRQTTIASSVVTIQKDSRLQRDPVLECDPSSLSWLHRQISS